jgi:hypothetical protein
MHHWTVPEGVDVVLGRSDIGPVDVDLGDERVLRIAFLVLDPT